MTRAVEKLYSSLLRHWDERDAKAYASLFAPNGNVIGFDGSQMNGQNEIEKELTKIFAGHPTASYVSKVREVRDLSPTVQVLRAVAGMVPPNETSIKADVNAIQTLVASKAGADWQIELFQNTPAQFHGRPELVDALTKELNEILR